MQILQMQRLPRATVDRLQQVMPPGLMWHPLIPLQSGITAGLPLLRAGQSIMMSTWFVTVVTLMLVILMMAVVGMGIIIAMK